jgi:hypothetical protein
LTNSHVVIKIVFVSKVYDEIRKAIKASSKTRYRLWQETGIDQALLARFKDEKSGLSVESIENLVDALGLEIVIRTKTIKKRKVKYGKRD